MTERQRKSIRQTALENSPWMPVAYEPADASAIQAIDRGEADADQQKRGLNWIINLACATYDQSYRTGPDGERDTAFAEGRRFVGNSVIKMTKLNVSSLVRNENA